MSERESAEMTSDYRQSGLPDGGAFVADDVKRHAPRHLRWKGLFALFGIGAAMLIAGILLD